MPPTPRIGGFLWLRSGLEFLEVVVVFVEVVADRNEKKLGADEIETSSSRSSVIAVLLHDPEGAFRLDGTVPSQQSAVDGVQVLEHFFVDLSQFLVQSDGTILVGLLALCRIRTIAAILTDVDLFLPSVVVAFDGPSVGESHPATVGADQLPLFVCLEVDGTEGIGGILPVLRLLFVHGELHVQTHPVGPAEQVIVVGAVASVGYWKLRVKPI